MLLLVMVKVITMFMNTVIIRSHHDGDHDDNYDNDEGGNHKYEYDGDYGETVIMATKMMIVVVGRIMIILWKVLGRVVSDEDYGISDNDDENDNDDDDEAYADDDGYDDAAADDDDGVYSDVYDTGATADGDVDDDKYNDDDDGNNGD